MAEYERRRARRRLAAFALLAALLALIVFAALPSTLARYQGSHTWVIPDCVQCHTDIGSETSLSELRATTEPHFPHNDSVAINNSACMTCHSREGMRSGGLVTDVHGHNVTYSDCAKCHIQGDAGTYQDEVLWLNSSAHGPMVRNNSGDMGWADNTTLGQNLMSNTSKGCIACHTQVPVTIRWTRKMGLNLTYDATDDTTTFSTYTNESYDERWTVTDKTT